MKNISLALNVVLLIAVGVLFYLHFSQSTPAQQTSGSATSNFRVAYIKSDTVLKYYDYVKVNRERIDAKGTQFDRDLKARATALQGEFESYQRNQGSLTIGQARAVEEDLTKKRQNLQMYQDNLSQQMLAEQEKMTRELYEKVTVYLRQYCQDNGLQVVFKYDNTSDLLYGGDSLDISKEVIKGLNEAYRLEKQKATAADSTAKKKK